MRKYEIAINGKDFEVHIEPLGGDMASVEVNGVAYEVELKKVRKDKSAVTVSALPTTGPAPIAPPTAPTASAGGGAVGAPIPGAILEIFVKEGDAVSAGQAILKMEAMKMENEITADKSGTVTSIKVAVGDAVIQGQDLLIIG